jgi:hypothetical protein
MEENIMEENIMDESKNPQIKTLIKKLFDTRIILNDLKIDPKTYLIKTPTPSWQNWFYSWPFSSQERNENINNAKRVELEIINTYLKLAKLLELNLKGKTGDIPIFAKGKKDSLHKKVWEDINYIFKKEEDKNLEIETATGKISVPLDIFCSSHSGKDQAQNVRRLLGPECMTGNSGGAGSNNMEHKDMEDKDMEDKVGDVILCAHLANANANEINKTFDIYWSFFFGNKDENIISGALKSIQCIKKIIEEPENKILIIDLTTHSLALTKEQLVQALRQRGLNNVIENMRKDRNNKTIPTVINTETAGAKVLHGAGTQIHSIQKSAQLAAKEFSDNPRTKNDHQVEIAIKDLDILITKDADTIKNLKRTSRISCGLGIASAILGGLALGVFASVPPVGIVAICATGIFGLSTIYNAYKYKQEKVFLRRTKISGLIAAIGKRLGYHIIMHCKSGNDRTNGAEIAYRAAENTYFQETLSKADQKTASQDKDDRSKLGTFNNKFKKLAVKTVLANQGAAAKVVSCVKPWIKSINDSKIDVDAIDVDAIQKAEKGFFSSQTLNEIANNKWIVGTGIINEVISKSSESMNKALTGEIELRESSSLSSLSSSSSSLGEHLMMVV